MCVKKLVTHMTFSYCPSLDIGIALVSYKFRLFASTSTRNEMKAVYGCRCDRFGLRWKRSKLWNSLKVVCKVSWKKIGSLENAETSHTAVHRQYKLSRKSSLICSNNRSLDLSASAYHWLRSTQSYLVDQWLHDVRECIGDYSASKS